MKYKYKLNNLDCPNCANKIECKLNQEKDIISAKVNFSKLELTIETNKEGNIKEFISLIIKDIEPNVKISDLKDKIDNSYTIKIKILRLVLGIIVSILGIFVFKNTISNILIILGYIILLSKTAYTAIRLLLKSRTLDENLLVTISCIGAYFTNNITEGLMVITLYEIGKLLEFIAVNNSRKSITELMDIKPEYANLKVDNELNKVSPEMVCVGDIIVILEGERVPLDGIVLKGSAKLNMQALTGESRLKEVNIDDIVLSGSINTKGLLEIKVTNTYESSTVSKILSLTETATDRKAKIETMVTKVAKYYTPIVLILAIIVALSFPLLFNISFTDSIYRALVFLVISCPCAIAISVPLSYFSGIGASSKKGILIKGSDYLDSISRIKEIIFDKTGTLTTGKFLDYKLDIIDDNYTKEEILTFLVSGESLSNHPIAKSIVSIFNNVKAKKVINFMEVSGRGISYEINNNKIKIGSSLFCKNKENDGLIYININNKNIAKLELSDQIRKDAKSTINKLKRLGIKTKMYTGDDKEIATNVANKLGIDEVYYELLPQDKYKLLEDTLVNKHGLVAFVGDGINDAPSLALADIGISMGGVGSDSAIESSDIVIMKDELNKIIEAINISKKTNKIIKQNLIFAIGIKLLVLLLSALGISSMWQAVFADTGLTLLTIMNTTRILKTK
ncbi:MAG: cadmium-translocating P-type ATPase [Bacilli bacterium]|nr:cadmium-translocating P-type ATPase [Bacilli bacterium]